MSPPAARRWRVHKFGGSSIADADGFRRAAGIIEADGSRCLAIVLSACQGVTDSLLDAVASAESADAVACEATLGKLRSRHSGIATKLLGKTAAGQFLAGLESDLADIASILHAVRLCHSAGDNVRDRVVGFGELWSSKLFAGLLGVHGRRPGIHWIDARKIVTVEWGALGPVVRWDESTANARSEIPECDDSTLVITGYIARDQDGRASTLGRNGSDFSASIFGALLQAAEIVIWTDVDGVLSADPRQVPEARVIPWLSYNEAMELAYFGARVIHPQTMAPAVRHGIPIWIRNTLSPAQPGTKISAEKRDGREVKGITSVEGIALMNVEGAGMIGVPGTAHRLFGALRDASISVVMISQGSSEHSICFAIPDHEAETAITELRRAFAAELRDGQIQDVQVVRGCSIVAIVGDSMAGAHGIAAKFLGALGRAAINVRAIAQGSSERNLSVVVDGVDAARALRTVHAGFYLSPHTLSIGLIGPGNVGATLLEQLASQAARFRSMFNLDLQVRGIATSRRMLLADSAIDLRCWREQIEKDGEPLDLRRFSDHMSASHLPHRVLIDCTADAGVAECYLDWFRAGLHLVTPNKKANSASMSRYREMDRARRQSGSRYFYEATVGAGLPIILTLRDLRETGDEIRQIEGIFSGTLAYLFNRYDGSQPFSGIVADARSQGFTEPDPRDDLSGADVARKVVILAREIGLELELADVEVQSLVPQALSDCDVDEFMARLHEFDSEMLALLTKAQQADRLLRYVARLTGEGLATVRIEQFDRSHPFASMALSDNIVRFETARYCDNPLVIQGPGAGPAVTAGGVFGDLLRLAAGLGTPI